MKTKTSEQLKELVKEKYTQIAEQSKDTNEASCCGATGCCTVDYTVMADDYTKLDGYVADADLGLGCGLPTAFAQIKEGDTVVDLGSGAGNDAFVARSITGENGKVIGIDFTDKMIEKAIANAQKLNYTNVEFRQGDIENMPLAGTIADVVVSNCVLNLVPNKEQAFAETFRILKKGGHFSVSDIVLVGELPEGLQKSAAMYAGCISGAIQKDEYLDIIKKAGFDNITIQKEKRITLPDEILKDYLSATQISEFKTGKTGIFSVTVYAEKPEKLLWAFLLQEITNGPYLVNQMEKIQTRIIGSGPAGYTAAIYAARANLKPVLYQSMEPGGQRMTTNDVENFTGYPDGIMEPHMMACEEALYLSKLATKVHIIVRKNQMRAYQIMQERVMKTSTVHVYFNAGTNEIPGDAVVTGVRIKNVNTGETKEIAIEGFFVAIGHKPNADIFRNYLALDEQGYILTTPGPTKTNIEGVFACGDVQDKHFRQAITAAGTGCRAALEAERFPAAKEVEATL